MSIEKYEQLLVNDEFYASILLAYKHMERALKLSTEWFGALNVPGDFGPLFATFDEQKVRQLLRVYSVAAERESQSFENVYNVYLSAVGRGKFNYEFMGSSECTEFCEMARNLLVNVNNPLEEFRLLVDACAFEAYLKKRVYYNNIMQVYSLFTVSERKVSEFKGVSVVLRRLLGERGAYILAYNEYVKWNVNRKLISVSESDMFGEFFC